MPSLHFDAIIISALMTIIIWPWMTYSCTFRVNYASTAEDRERKRQVVINEEALRKCQEREDVNTCTNYENHHSNRKSTWYWIYSVREGSGLHLTESQNYFVNCIDCLNDTRWRFASDIWSFFAVSVSCFTIFWKALKTSEPTMLGKYIHDVWKSQKKSHCERSELRLHFEWTKVN